MDNHDTPQGERLEAAFKHIMADRRIVKRLRYSMALIKVGQGISLKQAEMLASDIMPYMDRQGAMVETSDIEMAIFTQALMEEAWNSGTLEENFRTLKVAREKTR